MYWPELDHEQTSQRTAWAVGIGRHDDTSISTLPLRDASVTAP